MNNILFCDNTTSNSEIRAANIAALNAAGFVAGGLPCRSGELCLVEKNTKCQLVFGMRCAKISPQKRRPKPLQNPST